MIGTRPGPAEGRFYLQDLSAQGLALCLGSQAAVFLDGGSMPARTLCPDERVGSKCCPVPGRWLCAIGGMPDQLWHADLRSADLSRANLDGAFLGGRT